MTAAPAPAAEPAPLVDRPQHALLLRDSGGGTRIWIDALTPQRLTYRACDTSTDKETLTALPGIRAAVKLLSGDVFAIDPRTGRFDRFDELTGKFTAALDKAAAADPQSGSEIHTEIAEGTGTNASEALREAFRTAVRQAVGVYVDSETLSQKEEIVSDRLTTFSDAFIVRYEELERETVDDLVRVKISAAIEVGKMLADLRAAKIDTLDLAGQDLVASAVTRKEARDAAAALLYRKLCELPNVLSASALPFQTGDYDAETGKLTVTYTLLTDRDRYRAFLDSALPLLAQVAKGKTVQLVKVKPVWCDGSAPAWETTTAEDRAGKKRLAGVTTTDSPPFRLGPDLSSLPDSWCLWLMTRWSRDHLSTQWTGFALDIDLAKTLGDVEGAVRVQLDLVDAAGEVVRSETHDPLAALPRPAYWFGWAIARPRRFDAKAPRTWPPASSLYGAPILLTSFHEPEFAVHQNQTVNVYVNPLCFSVIGPGQVKLSPGAWQILEMPIDADTLARVKSIRATPIFVPHE